MSILSGNDINAKCELRDKNLEMEYLNYRYHVLKSGFWPVVFILGAFYFLFLVPDYLMLGTAAFVNVVLLRLAAVAVFIIVYFAFGRIRDPESYSSMLTVYELLFPVFITAMMSNYGQIKFYVRCLDMILIMAVIFLVPNKWLNSVLASLFNIIVFLAYIRAFASYVQTIDLLTGATYLFMVYVILAIANFNMNNFKRKQFIYNRQLRNMVETDVLTGTVSRAKFNEEFERLITKTRETGLHLSLTIFDIDDFKSINDTYGHLTGDKVLKGIADIVNAYINPDRTFARWGGEEFAIILPGTRLALAEEEAGRLREKIAEFSFTMGIRITCSFGVTELLDDDTSLTCLRRADENMYRAKKAGKNTVFAE